MKKHKKYFRGLNLEVLKENVEIFKDTIKDKNPEVQITRNQPDYVITVQYDE